MILLISEAIVVVFPLPVGPDIIIRPCCSIDSLFTEAGILRSFICGMADGISLIAMPVPPECLKILQRVYMSGQPSLAATLYATSISPDCSSLVIDPEDPDSMIDLHITPTADESIAAKP